MLLLIYDEPEEEGVERGFEGRHDGVLGRWDSTETDQTVEESSETPELPREEERYSLEVERQRNVKY